MKIYLKITDAKKKCRAAHANKNIQLLHTCKRVEYIYPHNFTRMQTPNLVEMGNTQKTASHKKARVVAPGVSDYGTKTLGGIEGVAVSSNIHVQVL